MFRQAVSNSSRALRSVPRLTAQQALRPQFQTAPFAAPVRAFQPAASRWYSDAKETPAEGEKAEAKEEKGGDEVAQLKKDLEAKDAEAREWKVSTCN